MLHKNVRSSLRSGSTDVTCLHPVTRESHLQPELAPATRLRLVPPDLFQPGSFQPGSFPPDGGNPPHPRPSHDLLGIAAGKCSSFLAEAAVLVLVLALLDRFMLKGRLEPGWIVSALVISMALLAGSILTDFSARRWLR